MKKKAICDSDQRPCNPLSGANASRRTPVLAVARSAFRGLDMLAPVIFFALFLTVQFSSQLILGVRCDVLMLFISIFAFLTYWPRTRVLPSAGVLIFMCAMAASTILLASRSISWRQNASCVNVLAVFWATIALSRTMSNKQVTRLLMIGCFTAFVISVYQFVVFYGDKSAAGIAHPDFEWAMYGTILPGQCAYLALWTFMFLPGQSKSKFRFSVFALIYTLNCVFAAFYNIRLMVPILVVAAILPWLFHCKLKTICLRSGAFLLILVSIIALASIRYTNNDSIPDTKTTKTTIIANPDAKTTTSVNPDTKTTISANPDTKTTIIANPYTKTTLSERMLAICDDGGSGRLELWKNAAARMKKKNIPSLLLGDGASCSVIASKGRDLHNIYFETLDSFGVLGLVGLLTIAVTLIRSEYKNRFRNPIGTTLVIYLMVGLVLFGFREPIIWLLLGGYEACNRREVAILKHPCVKA